MRVLTVATPLVHILLLPRIKGLEAHVSEIPPGGATPTHRHTCEAFFYVIFGKGYSVIRTDTKPQERITWQTGDMFCTPTQTWHRHVNVDQSNPARYLEITTIPLMKSLGHWQIEAGESGPAKTKATIKSRLKGERSLERQAVLRYSATVGRADDGSGKPSLPI